MMIAGSLKHLEPQSKAFLDVSSVLVVLGTLAEALPALAALASLTWSIIRIVETRTGQGWRGRNPNAASHMEMTDDPSS